METREGQRNRNHKSIIIMFIHISRDPVTKTLLIQQAVSSDTAMQKTDGTKF